MAPEEPEFVKTLPPEARLYGGDAAIVLAHIRFRCQRPQRRDDDYLEHDGHAWWRVSYEYLSAETGVKVKTVRTSVTKLERAGVLLANNLPPYNDRRRCYRLQAADLPLAATGTSLTSDKPAGAGDVPEGADHLPVGAVRLPVGADAPIYQESLEGGEGADAPTPPTPPKLTLVSKEQTAGLPDDLPPQPPPRCDKSPDGDNCSTPCRQCQAVREWQEAAAAEAAEAHALFNRQVRAAIKACPECDGNGLVDGDNQVRRCTLHPNLDSLAAAGGAARGDTGGPSSDAHRATQPLRHAAKPAPAQGAS